METIAKYAALASSAFIFIPAGRDMISYGTFLLPGEENIRPLMTMAGESDILETLRKLDEEVAEAARMKKERADAEEASRIEASKVNAFGARLNEARGKIDPVMSPGIKRPRPMRVPGRHGGGGDGQLRQQQLSGKRSTSDPS